MFDDDYKSWSSLCSFLHASTTSSVLGLNIFLSTLFSNTFILCSSRTMSCQVLHPYKTRGKTVYFNIYGFWQRTGRQNILSRMVFLEFNQLLISSGRGLRHCATNRTVPGSIPGSVTGDFFRGSPRWNHVPWGRLSPWKWIPGISPGVKAAGAYGWRPTTAVVPNVKKIRDLNLRGSPLATAACCGIPPLISSCTQFQFANVVPKYFISATFSKVFVGISLLIGTYLYQTSYPCTQ